MYNTYSTCNYNKKSIAQAKSAVAFTPTKLERTNEKPTIHFFDFFFNFLDTEKTWSGHDSKHRP